MPIWCRLSLTLAAVSIVTITAADAASPRVRRACSGDVQRLCPKYKADSPELRYCMEAKINSVSQGCIRALEDEGTVPRGMFRR